jgi:hypothetical protein
VRKRWERKRQKGTREGGGERRRREERGGREMGGGVTRVTEHVADYILYLN